MKPDNVQILCSGEAGQGKNQILVFFLTKRRQKKTRDEFNSEYEKIRSPRRGWVLLKWPILAIFVKKKSVFFDFLTAARANQLEIRKKTDFFLRIRKISYRQPGSVLKGRFFWIHERHTKNEKLCFFATRGKMCYIGHTHFARMGSIAWVRAALPRVWDHKIL